MASPDRQRLLGIYLNDHLTGATAGVELSARLAKSHQHGEWAAELARLAREVREDRTSLLTAMRRLGVRPNSVLVGVAWLGEKVARLKTNGSLVQRSPLSSVVELEMMMLGVRGKAAGWRTLHALAEHDDRLDADTFVTLQSRADDQIDRLEALRVAAVANALGPVVRRV